MQFTSKSGKTITVRPPTMSDTDIMLEFINELGREDIYLNVNPADLYTKEEEEAFVADCISKIKAKTQIHLLAFYENQLIGSCTVTKQDKRRSHVGVFGIIITKAFRSDGIGEQLATLAIDTARQQLNISLIVLDVYKPNQPAQKLYQKLGFRPHGVLPEGLSYQGKFIDQILMYKRL